MNRDEGKRRRRRSWLRRLLSALGGADNRLLDKAAAVDAREMEGRGFAAIIPAVFGCLALIIAFRYAYSVPLKGAVAAGLGWGAIVVLFDLSLMTIAPDHGSFSKLIAFGLRAIVSVLAALTFAGAIVLFMFAKDIGTQLANDNTTAFNDQVNQVIVPAYNAAVKPSQQTIAAAQQAIGKATQAVTYWQRQVNNAQVQVTCEQGGVSQLIGCGQGTGQVGKGPAYDVRVAELAADEGNLSRAKAALAAADSTWQPQLAQARSGIGAAQRSENDQEARARTRYQGNTGLIARWQALGELEAGSTTVREQAWFLEGLIIAVDLSAVIVKLSSKTRSYNRALTAERKKDELRAVLREERAGHAVERRRAEHEAATYLHQAWLDAQVQVTLAAIAAWVEWRLRQISTWLTDQPTGQGTGSAGRWNGWQPPPRPGGQPSAGAPIGGPTLGRLIKRQGSHEERPEDFRRPLTLLAWTGVGLLAVLTGAVFLADAAGLAVTGGWLAVASVAVALALAVYTRGFRRGPIWAHRAASATGWLGLVLPLVILLVNV